jgi:hypothetical protein
MAKLPLAAMLLMLSTPEPLLVRVTVLAVLVVLMTTLPKLNAVGDSVTAAPFTCCVNTGDVLPRKFVSPL